jgi:multidrug efflux pump subunit AcrA (membrane-fusion protein)
MPPTERKRRPKVLIWLLPLVVLVGLIAWRITQKKAEAAQEAKSTAARKNAPLNVEAVPVTKRTIIKSFAAVGSIEAPSTVQVSPRVTGRLLEILVREGDRVTPGQVLARIDPRETRRIYGNGKRRSRPRVRASPKPRQSDLAERGRLFRSRAKPGRACDRAGAEQPGPRRLRGVDRHGAGGGHRRVRAGYCRAGHDPKRGCAIQAAQADLENSRVLYGVKPLYWRKGLFRTACRERQDRCRGKGGAVRTAREQRANAVATRDAAVATRKSLERQVTIARNKANAMSRSQTLPGTDPRHATRRRANTSQARPIRRISAPSKRPSRPRKPSCNPTACC